MVSFFKVQIVFSDLLVGFVVLFLQFFGDDKLDWRYVSLAFIPLNIPLIGGCFLWVSAGYWRAP